MTDSKKICKQCQVEKSVVDFYEQQQRGDNGQIWRYYDCYCKDCRLQYSHDRRKSIKAKAVQYKGGKCEDCNLVDIPEIYDFHHLNPASKDFSIGKRSNLKFDTIQKELDKCILLCSNCHRKRHIRDF